MGRPKRNVAPAAGSPQKKRREATPPPSFEASSLEAEPEPEPERKDWFKVVLDRFDSNIASELAAGMKYHPSPDVRKFAQLFSEQVTVHMGVLHKEINWVLAKWLETNEINLDAAAAETACFDELTAKIKTMEEHLHIAVNEREAAAKENDAMKTIIKDLVPFL